MTRELHAVLTSYSAERHSLLRILQAVQKELGYLPDEALIEVARHLKVSALNFPGGLVREVSSR